MSYKQRLNFVFKKINGNTCNKRKNCHLNCIAQRLEHVDIAKETCFLSEEYGFTPPEKLSDIVLESGFADMRTFRRALSASEGKWAQIIRGKIY